MTEQENLFSLIPRTQAGDNEHWLHVFAHRHIVQPNLHADQGNWEETVRFFTSNQTHSLPHVSDETTTAALRSFFDSPWFIPALRPQPTENLEQTFRRIWEAENNNEWLVPVEYQDRRAFRQGIARRILFCIKIKFQLIETATTFRTRAAAAQGELSRLRRDSSTLDETVTQLRSDLVNLRTNSERAATEGNAAITEANRQIAEFWSTIPEEFRVVKDNVGQITRSVSSIVDALRISQQKSEELSRLRDEKISAIQAILDPLGKKIPKEVKTDWNAEKVDQFINSVAHQISDLIKEADENPQLREDLEDAKVVENNLRAKLAISNKLVATQDGLRVQIDELKTNRDEWRNKYRDIQTVIQEHIPELGLEPVNAGNFHPTLAVIVTLARGEDFARLLRSWEVTVPKQRNEFPTTIHNFVTSLNSRLQDCLAHQNNTKDSLSDCLRHKDSLTSENRRLQAEITRLAAMTNPGEGSQSSGSARPITIDAQNLWLTLLTQEERNENGGGDGDIPAALDGEGLMNLIGRIIMQRAAPPAPLDCTHRRDLALALGAQGTQTWAESYATVRTLKTFRDPPVGPSVLEVATQPCNHIQALASLLNIIEVTDWERLLAEVRRLMTPAAVAPPAGAATGVTFVSGDRPFKEGSFPEWSKKDGYWAWRCQAVRAKDILSSGPTAIRDDESTAAVNLIIKRITFDEGILYFQVLNVVAEVIRPTWELTWERFLEALDSTFLNKDGIYTQCRDAWNNFRGTQNMSSLEFYTGFQENLWRLREICRIHQRYATAEPTQAAIAAKFVDALPKAVSDAMEIKHGGDWRVQDPLTMDRRNEIQSIWDTLVKPPGKVRFLRSKVEPEYLPAKRGRVQYEDSDSEVEREAAVRAAARRKLSGPSIRDAPEQYQGSITARPGDTTQELVQKKKRRELIRKRKLCSVCRHPRHGHSDHEFTETTPWVEPMARAARVASLPQEEPVGEEEGWKSEDE